MSATLYLIRQDLDLVSPSLFRTGDANIDIVFVERAASISPSLVEGVTVTSEGIADLGSRPTVTYDELVEKIFLSEHVIVL